MNDSKLIVAQAHYFFVSNPVQLKIYDDDDVYTHKRGFVLSWLTATRKRELCVVTCMHAFHDLSLCSHTELTKNTTLIKKIN